MPRNICKSCGVEFETKQSRTQACSSKCRQCLWRLRRSLSRLPRKCQTCDAVLIPEYRSHMKKCRRCVNLGLFVRKCKKCHIEFVGKFFRSLCQSCYADGSAWRRWLPKTRKPKKPLPVVTKQCPKCGTLFDSFVYLNKNSCSDKCRGKYRFLKGRDRASMIAKLVKRDGRKCCICLGKLDFKLKYPDDMSVSIDHIVPRSLGGTNKIDNCQLAHLKCNCEVKVGHSSYRAFLFV